MVAGVLRGQDPTVVLRMAAGKARCFPKEAHLRSKDPDRVVVPRDHRHLRLEDLVVSPPQKVSAIHTENNRWRGRPDA